jgi:hypothetical protein
MTYLLFFFGCLILATLWVVSNQDSARKRLTEKLDGIEKRLGTVLAERFDQIERKLETIGETVGELEYRSLTPEEKESRAFGSARPLTLSDFEQVKPGQILSLMACSWFYPSTRPAFETFDYKHESLGGPTEVNKKTYYAVNGFERWGESQDWSPCTLYAADDECATQTFQGSVRRL